jgi:hypothetical protein
VPKIIGTIRTFTGLTDTPIDYDGQLGKAVVVNSSEDGVVFSDPAGASSGLNKYLEGGRFGWRLLDRDSLNYANLGESAIDFSLSDLVGQFYGASGDFAVAYGYLNRASGKHSVVGGVFSIASGDFSSAFGNSLTTIAESSFLRGISLDVGDSPGVVVLGTANIPFVGAGVADRFNSDDPILIVGNGTYDTPVDSEWPALVESNALFLD